jgi:hypothetical protein
MRPHDGGWFRGARGEAYSPAVAALSSQTRTFDPGGLPDLLDGRYADIRREILTVMRGPEFAPVVALPSRETREVNGLCNETRLCAAGLVDAFGILDEVLGARIGLTDDPETPD